MIAKAIQDSSKTTLRCNRPPTIFNQAAVGKSHKDLEHPGVDVVHPAERLGIEIGASRCARYFKTATLSRLPGAVGGCDNKQVDKKPKVKELSDSLHTISKKQLQPTTSRQNTSLLASSAVLLIGVQATAT